MKVMKIVGVSALAVGLVLGLASPALAAPPNRVPLQVSQMPPRLLVGEVVSINANQQIFVIQSGLQEVTVSVDGDTQYYEAPIPWRVIPPVRRMVELRQQSQKKANSSPVSECSSPSRKSNLKNVKKTATPSSPVISLLPVSVIRLSSSLTCTQVKKYLRNCWIK